MNEVAKDFKQINSRILHVKVCDKSVLKKLYIIKFIHSKMFIIIHHI